MIDILENGLKLTYLYVIFYVERKRRTKYPLIGTDYILIWTDLAKGQYKKYNFDIVAFKVTLSKINLLSKQ